MAKCTERPDFSGEGELFVSVTFHAPTRRSFDLDNALAATKAGIDGVSDAWGVNDKRFSFLVRRGEPHKGGHVWLQFGGSNEPISG